MVSLKSLIVMSSFVATLFNFEASASRVPRQELAELRNHSVNTRQLIFRVDSLAHLESLKKNINLPLDEVLNIRPLFIQASGLIKKIGGAYSQPASQAQRRLEKYFNVQFRHALGPEAALNILTEFYSHSEIETAYFSPLLRDGTFLDNQKHLPVKWNGRLNKVSDDDKPVVPDFENLQYHLNPAPLGLDARYAWTLPGGSGRDIRVFDFDMGWVFNHFDFNAKPFYWNKINNMTEGAHGQAVWGLIAAARNGTGTSGIAYDAHYAAVGDGDEPWSDLPRVLEQSLDDTLALMKPNDVILIELQGQGPNNQPAPVEYWDGVFDVLKTITSLGVHCVEIAGNGGSNLDAPIYERKFDGRFRDSGCILVGAAGAPGSQFHQRLSFSNYGSRVDVFGYGEKVVTTGWTADLFKSARYPGVYDYTASFDGTSSSAAMVSGAVASILGVELAVGRHLPPLVLRRALRATGSPQLGDIDKHIGNLPNIKQVVELLGQHL